MKHYKLIQYKLLDFLLKLNVWPHLHECKPACTNVKPLLMTFWQLFRL